MPLRTSSAVPPYDRSQTFAPAASTRTTQISLLPNDGLVLFPVAPEVEVPPTTTPPSLIGTTWPRMSVPWPPNDCSQIFSPLEFIRTIQKSNSPLFSLVLVPSSPEIKDPPAMNPP